MGKMNNRKEGSIMADMFTNALRLFIDNNEDEIFNICWKVDASAYSLESDMREIVRNKIDFDWLASVYLDDVQDALLTT